jgi:hypothetical protein
MAIERTFSIIKPDATERNLTGAINALIEKAGLRIVAQKRIRMTREQAGTFYAVHKARPFFGELVDFMISAPILRRRPTAPSASCMRSRSVRTRCMVRTPSRPPRSKSRSFSRATKSSANRR